MSRYDFLKNSDEHSYDNSYFLARLPVNTLEIPPSAISPDGTQWLHCVEAVKQDDKLRLRIITNTHRGINVTIPCTTLDMHYKYCDLRFQVRHSERVMITFPKIFIRSSLHRGNEIYLLAYDFKILNPDTKSKQPTIYI